MGHCTGMQGEKQPMRHARRALPPAARAGLLRPRKSLPRYVERFCRPRRAVIPEWRMRGRSWRFESDNNKLNSREISTLTGIREGQQNHEPRPSMSDIGRAVPE